MHGTVDVITPPSTSNRPAVLVQFVLAPDVTVTSVSGS